MDNPTVEKLTRMHVMSHIYMGSCVCLFGYMLCAYIFPCVSVCIFLCVVVNVQNYWGGRESSHITMILVRGADECVNPIFFFFFFYGYCANTGYKTELGKYQPD